MPMPPKSQWTLPPLPPPAAHRLPAGPLPLFPAVPDPTNEFGTHFTIEGCEMLLTSLAIRAVRLPVADSVVGPIVPGSHPPAPNLVNWMGTLEHYAKRLREVSHSSATAAAAVVARHKQLHNLYVSVAGKLPNELLDKIFWHTVLGSAPSGHYPRVVGTSHKATSVAALRLGAVSRKWRVLACGQRELWGQISHEMPPSICNLFLQRARGGPLDLTVDVRPIMALHAQVKPNDLVKLNDQALRHYALGIGRWAMFRACMSKRETVRTLRLTLGFHFGLLSVQEEFYKAIFAYSYPALEILDLTLTTGISTHLVRYGMVAMVFPKIRSLTLRNVPLAGMGEAFALPNSHCMNNLPTLRHLHIALADTEVTSPSAFLNFLRTMPNLESLYLKNVKWGSPLAIPYGEPVKLRDLKELSFMDTCPRRDLVQWLELPALQRMALSYRSDDGAEDVLLQNAPHVKELLVWDSSGALNRPPHRALSLLAGGRPPRTEWCPSHSSSISEEYEYLPKLEKLVISPYYFHDWDALEESDSEHRKVSEEEKRAQGWLPQSPTDLALKLFLHRRATIRDLDDSGEPALESLEMFVANQELMYVAVSCVDAVGIHSLNEQGRAMYWSLDMSWQCGVSRMQAEPR